SAVAASPPDGDVGLKAKLVERGLLLADLPLPEEAGVLLPSLVEQGFVSARVIDDFQRDLVRDASLALIAQTTGTYRFVEERSFVDFSLLHKVNPFGMIFEARRRATPPQVLLSRAGELSSKVLVPQPLLPAAARKLRPFVRDHDLATVLDRPRTVLDLREATGLDDLMGTLVALTLIDAQLVQAVDAVPALTLDLPARQRGNPSNHSDTADSGGTTDTDALADELLDLYVRLKPQTAPRSILGVGDHIDQDTLRRAYLDLMATLDPARLSEGPEHRILRARVLEMRDKVANAFRELGG
ncbi:MAG: hypothetical protein ACO3JL_11740, partial [Myxococcota bacterium]